MDKQIIAQIGLGYWGKNILRNLYELGILHTACDRDKTLLGNLKKNYSNINFTDNFEDLVENSEIKAIVISTPAITHYELVKRSLLFGKDVFVEKPLALTVEQGKELVEIAKSKNRILMVGHILHYHPAVKKLKDIIDSGGLGKIQYAYSNRLNIGKLRTEENILWSFAPHDISIILKLIGEEPITVYSTGGDYLNKGIYDTTLTIFEFKNGTTAHVYVSWLHPYKEQKLIVIGSKGMLVFDDVSKEKLFLYPHKIEWKDGKIPIAQKVESEIIQIANEEPLKNELIHFYECVLERKNPITDGEEGLRVLRILGIAESSIVKGSKIYMNTEHKEQISKEYFIHQTAIIDEDVLIEKGTKIWHFSHILKNSKIGEDCVIGQNVVIGPDVYIGNKCKIQNNVSVYKGVILEDEVFCGPSCVFTNVYNPRAFIERKHEFKHTLVKKGATIGANATIVCGVTIGKYAMIGAGAVVKSDVPDYAVVAGVPARQIGWTCKCGTTLKIKDSQSEVCQHCGNEYMLKDKSIVPLKES